MFSVCSAGLEHPVLCVVLPALLGVPLFSAASVRVGNVGAAATITVLEHGQRSYGAAFSVQAPILRCGCSELLAVGCLLGSRAERCPSNSTLLVLPFFPFCL